MILTMEAIEMVKVIVDGADDMCWHAQVSCPHQGDGQLDIRVVMDM